jgi:hypothetical protein
MRKIVFGLATSALLIGAMAGPAVAGTPRAADIDNARDALAAYPDYDNAVTRAVPEANGVVVTPAGGGKSPPCKITVTGLLPNSMYKVNIDVDGGEPGPFWEWREPPFMTNKDGDGQYRCAEPIGDGARVYINDRNEGTPYGRTVGVSDEVNDS